MQAYIGNVSSELVVTCIFARSSTVQSCHPGAPLNLATMYGVVAITVIIIILIIVVLRMLATLSTLLWGRTRMTFVDLVPFLSDALLSMPPDPSALLTYRPNH